MSLLLLSCGGKVETTSPAAKDKVFFDPASANDLAHAALLDAAALPGGGWTVTQRDAPDDESDSVSLDFLTHEPACAQIDGLEALADLLGDTTAEPAGHADIEYERTNKNSLVPTDIDLEVGVLNTVEEVDKDWKVVKPLFDSDDTRACFTALMDKEMEEIRSEGAKIQVTLTAATSPAPQNGTALSFDIAMTISGQSFDLKTEMYFWTYGNAEVSAMFSGLKANVLNGVTGPVLRSFDQKLIDTERSQ